jgi:hypothetical protein
MPESIAQSVAPAARARNAEEAQSGRTAGSDHRAGRGSPLYHVVARELVVVQLNVEPAFRGQIPDDATLDDPHQLLRAAGARNALYD